MVDDGANLAPGLSGESDRNQSKFLGGLQSQNDIGGIAAGGNSDGNITGLSEGLHLASENLVEAEIVRDRGDARGVYRESKRRNPGAIKPVTTDEFRGNMLCIGCAATIPEEKYFMFALKRQNHKSGDTGNCGKETQIGQKHLLRGNRGLNAVSDLCFKLGYRRILQGQPLLLTRSFAGQVSLSIVRARWDGGADSVGAVENRRPEEEGRFRMRRSRRFPIFPLYTRRPSEAHRR